jgi:hypothetical protein
MYNFPKLFSLIFHGSYCILSAVFYYVSVTTCMCVCVHCITWGNCTLICKQNTITEVITVAESLALNYVLGCSTFSLVLLSFLV